MIITIDGSAGTGKSTVARAVAEKLGFIYFDTGAMYRAFTYLALKSKVALEDGEGIRGLLESFRFEIRSEGKGKRYFVDSEDVTDIIRSQEVTSNVSHISALPQVREALVGIQRQFGKAGNAVFEGRDMGSVVFPQAQIKVFLTARPAVRAERRYLETKNGSTEEVMKGLLERDTLDSTRTHSPLKQPEGAHLIDTSDLSIDEVVEHIVALVPRKAL